MPSDCTSASTLRVLTPCTYASATTATSACSARRRGSSQRGKSLPLRSFGMATSSVPSRVSQGRCRYPWRCVGRSSLRS
jgi:hypothetical protein